MKFTKMQALGNDFVVIEGSPPDGGLIRRLCDRRFGVGADGVLLVEDGPTMRYWNADGSPAEMCGNGLRCVARYAVDRDRAPTGEWFGIGTAVGSRRARVEGDRVTVEVGRVTLEETITIGGLGYRRADIGNPHAVALVEEPEVIDVAATGSAVSGATSFPAGCNVEFVAIETDDRIRLRVWERGVGETLACGSGMVVATAVARGTGEGTTTVLVPGGAGEVFFENGTGYLTGPAEEVFVGEWPGF